MDTKLEPAARAAKAEASLAKSADAIEDSSQSQADSADRRTVLAATRTMLAAERTYAAWVRTGLASLASGIGARTLLEDVVPTLMASATGSLLILFSAFCFAAAVWRELSPAQIEPAPEARHLPAWLLLIVNGFLVLVSLAALVGVWLG